MALECQRDRFDLPDDVAYLNTAYMSPLPTESVAAGTDGLTRKTRPWEITSADFFEPLTRARELFAGLVGADADGIALVPSVSYGLGVAAANLSVPAGRHAVVLAEQFPSNVYTWRHVAARDGGSVRTVARPVDGDWTEATLASIDAGTAVVAVPPCHWTDGTRLDLDAVGAAARATGAAFIVDACQAAGVLPIDVAGSRPDFLATATYKWLLGPYSCGFLWVAPHLRDGVPLEHNWIARRGSEDFAGLVDYQEEYQAGARRFDVGEVSNFALLPAVTRSLELVHELGVREIAGYGRALTDRIATAAEELGLGVAPARARSPHLIGIRLRDRADPEEVAARLAEARVYVSVRGDSVRVSTHVYNTEQDVDRLIDTLRATLR